MFDLDPTLLIHQSGCGSITAMRSQSPRGATSLISFFQLATAFNTTVLMAVCGAEAMTTFNAVKAAKRMDQILFASNKDGHKEMDSHIE